MSAPARATFVRFHPLIGFLLALSGTIFIAVGVILADSSETEPFATAFWRMALGGVLCAAMSRLVNSPDVVSQILQLTQPAFTVLIATLVLATPVYQTQVFGIAMIAGGLWVMLIPQSWRRPVLVPAR